MNSKRPAFLNEKNCWPGSIRMKAMNRQGVPQG